MPRSFFSRNSLKPFIHASMVFSLEAVFSLIFAVIFLGETFTLVMGLGFGLIFLALILTELELNLFVKIK